jgi:hypothetical protein
MIDSFVEQMEQIKWDTGSKLDAAGSDTISGKLFFPNHGFGAAMWQGGIWLPFMPAPPGLIPPLPGGTVRKPPSSASEQYEYDHGKPNWVITPSIEWDLKPVPARPNIDPGFSPRNPLRGPGSDTMSADFMGGGAYNNPNFGLPSDGGGSFIGLGRFDSACNIPNDMQPSTPSGGLFGPDFGVGPWDFPGYRTPGGEGIFLPVARRSGPSIPHAIDTSGLPSGRPGLSWPSGKVFSGGALYAKWASRLPRLPESRFFEYGYQGEDTPSERPEEKKQDPGVLCVGNSDGSSSYIPLKSGGGVENVDGKTVPDNDTARGGIKRHKKEHDKYEREAAIILAMLVYDIVDTVVTFGGGALLRRIGRSFGRKALRELGEGVGRKLGREAVEEGVEKLEREAAEAVAEGVARRGGREAVESTSGRAGRTARDILDEKFGKGQWSKARTHGGIPHQRKIAERVDYYLSQGYHESEIRWFGHKEGEKVIGMGWRKRGRRPDIYINRNDFEIVENVGKESSRERAVEKDIRRYLADKFGDFNFVEY